jgi:hypothetical protein
VKDKVIFSFLFYFTRELNINCPLVSISQIINQSKPIHPPCNHFSYPKPLSTFANPSAMNPP